MKTASSYRILCTQAHDIFLIDLTYDIYGIDGYVFPKWMSKVDWCFLVFLGISIIGGFHDKAAILRFPLEYYIAQGVPFT